MNRSVHFCDSPQPNLAEQTQTDDRIIALQFDVLHVLARDVSVRKAVLESADVHAQGDQARVGRFGSDLGSSLLPDVALYTDASYA